MARSGCSGRRDSCGWSCSRRRSRRCCCWGRGGGWRSSRAGSAAPRGYSSSYIPGPAGRRAPPAAPGRCWPAAAAPRKKIRCCKSFMGNTPLDGDAPPVMEWGCSWVSQWVFYHFSANFATGMLGDFVNFCGGRFLRYFLFVYGGILSFPKGRGVPRPGAGCLPAGYFLSLAKESIQELSFKERGFRFPLSPKILSLETTKREGVATPPLEPVGWRLSNRAFAALRQR